jgi:hypothetical protein
MRAWATAVFPGQPQNAVKIERKKGTASGDCPSCSDLWQNF